MHRHFSSTVLDLSDLEQVIVTAKEIDLYQPQHLDSFISNLHTLHLAAGKRIDPNVSVPAVRVVKPAAKEAVPPPLDPPGMYLISQGFRVVSKDGLVPVEPAASSCMFCFPNMIIPAFNSLSTVVAFLSGRKSVKSLEPSVVRIPWSGPLYSPRMISSSISLACWSAKSGSGVT